MSDTIQFHRTAMRNFPTNSSGFFYFIHPYTCTDATGNHVLAGEEANFRLCCWRTAQLVLRGYLVFSPICHSHPIHVASPEFLIRHEHDFWHGFDQHIIEHITWSGAIAAPGWQNSTGCVREKAWFEQQRMPVLWWENIMKETEPFVFGGQHE